MYTGREFPNFGFILGVMKVFSFHASAPEATAMRYVLAQWKDRGDNNGHARVQGWKGEKKNGLGNRTGPALAVVNFLM